MATSAGVIQGYTGVAAVDAGHQIIVDAQAYGTGSENELLLPAVTAIQPLLAPTSLITADAGYHSEAKLRALDALGIDALIADNAMRRRDERFVTQPAHKAAADRLHDKRRPPPPTPGQLPASAFTYDPEARTCVCPAGHALVRAGRNRVNRDNIWEAFQGTTGVCGPCPLREQCLKRPATTAVRTVNFHRCKTAPLPPTRSAQMRAAIDVPANRARYGRRLATVEPVFANLRHNKGLDRFALRGRAKVDAQWKLFCLDHNIEKLAHHGYAA
ncbi:MAG: transposase [Gemmatimonadaceae bacterium]